MPGEDEEIVIEPDAAITRARAVTIEHLQRTLARFADNIDGATERIREAATNTFIINDVNDTPEQETENTKLNAAGDYKAYYPLFDLGIIGFQTNEHFFHRCGCVKVRGNRRPFIHCDPENPHQPPSNGTVWGETAVLCYDRVMHKGMVQVEPNAFKVWRKQEDVNQIRSYLESKIRKPTKLSDFTKEAVTYFVAHQLDQDQNTVKIALSQYARDYRQKLKEAKSEES